MQRVKFLVTILIISCFLLDSSIVLADFTTVDFTSGASSSIKQVISEKDQEIINKFDNAKQWLEEQENSLQQFFTKHFSEFKNKMDEAFKTMINKFNELKEKTLNKRYTLVQENKQDKQTSNNSLPGRGLFLF